MKKSDLTEAIENRGWFNMTLKLSEIAESQGHKKLSLELEKIAVKHTPGTFRASKQQAARKINGQMTQAEFQDLYKKCKTFGDFDRLIETMPIELIHKMHDSMLFVQETTGLTMREDSFLVALKSFIKFQIYKFHSFIKFEY